ncbi:hypothetical protein [Flavobacterium sp. FlaQc-30]|uniref:hypothetical protein n=1 Tax=Flavobacterium sp. FlaQc-30 TaxID=3374179 RepID=UPI003756B385
MKKIFLKNSMSFVVIVLGISGAFATTFMQRLPEDKPPVIGYLVDAQGLCRDVSINCGTLSPFLCRLNGTTGPIAYEKDDNGTCVIPLYRP